MAVRGKHFESVQDIEAAWTVQLKTRRGLLELPRTVLGQREKYVRGGVFCQGLTAVCLLL